MLPTIGQPHPLGVGDILQALPERILKADTRTASRKYDGAFRD